MHNQEMQSRERSRQPWTFDLLIEGPAEDWMLNGLDKDGLKMSCQENRTRIRGQLEDISAVYGLIIGLRDMRINLLALEIKSPLLNK